MIKEIDKHNKREMKLKIGILGFGRFAESSLIPAFQKAKFAECIAITKRNKNEAINKAKKYKIKHAFENFGEDRASFLNLDEMDAVFIATPNSFHLRDTIEALNAKKHVILEKPMAMNTEQCEEIIRVARKNKKKIMIAHCLRYNSTILEVKKLIETNTIGEIIMATADFTSNGFLSKRPWKFDKKLAGGGSSFDLGVHMIDTLRFLLSSCGKIKEVQFLSKYYGKDEEILDLNTTFIFQFENGAIARASSTYEGPRQTALEIIGKKGFIRVYDWQPNFSKTKIWIRIEEIDENKKINTIDREIFVENRDMYTGEIDAFALSILENKDVPIPGEEGLENQKIIDLVNKKRL